MRKRLVPFLGIATASILAFVHWILPGIVEARLNRVLPHAPYSIRADVAEFHASLFIADLHSDSLLWKRNLVRRSEVGHLDLPRMQAGNVALQVFSATTKSPSGLNYEANSADSDDVTKAAILQFWPVATWTSIYARADYQLTKLRQFSETSDGDLRLIQSAEDLRAVIAARDAGQKIVAATFLIEGAHPLEGNLDNLARLYAKGLRIVGLTHFFDNEAGGSLHGIGGHGLTDFGRDVVRKAEELEMIIDVAHASPQMVRDVLATSSRPVILSHGGVKGICDRNRNLDDDLMRQIAEGGGLLGIGYWDGAVCDSRPEGIVASIRYAIDLMGVDHVALGSDFDGTVSVFLDSSELAILTQTMVDRGFTQTEVKKVMGENVKRFLLANLPAQVDRL